MNDKKINRILFGVNISFIFLIFLATFVAVTILNKYIFLSILFLALPMLLNIKMINKKSKYMREVFLGFPLLLSFLIAAILKRNDLGLLLETFFICYVIIFLPGFITYLVYRKKINTIQVPLYKSPSLLLVILSLFSIIVFNFIQRQYLEYELSKPPSYKKISQKDDYMNWIPFEGGFYDPKLKKYIIPPQFEEVKEYSDNGLAGVKINNKWGYINQDAQLVIPAQFLYYAPFKNGQAKVEKNLTKTETSLINKEGEVLKKHNYYNFLSNKNHEFEVVSNKIGGKRGYIDKNFNLVIPFKFYKAENFTSNGLALVQEEKNGKWGYINTKGEYVIPPKYDSALDFSSIGLAAAIDLSANKSGYINEKGKWVLHPSFKVFKTFANNGLAIFSRELYGKKGYINDKGKIIIPAKYTVAKDFNDSGLARVTLNNKYGVIDSQGKTIIPFKFDYIHSLESEYIAVEQNLKKGFINQKGKILIPFIFDNIYKGFNSNGYALVKRGTLKGYINKKAEWIVYKEKVCNKTVIRNSENKIIWPKNFDENCLNDKNKLIIDSSSKRKYTVKNETVIDTENKLMWMRCSFGQEWDGKSCKGSAKKIDLFTAFKEARKSTYGRHAGWRVPTKEELLTLVYCSNGKKVNNNKLLTDDCYIKEKPFNKPTIQEDVFSKFNLYSGVFLSSSYYKDTNTKVWGVSFDSGGAYTTEIKNKRRFRFVRDIK